MPNKNLKIVTYFVQTLFGTSRSSQKKKTPETKVCSGVLVEVGDIYF